AFNPHATFLVADGRRSKISATNPAWKKWLPSSPTSPHWYSAERLGGLIAAYLAQERNGAPPKTVRAFVAEVDGLTRSAKQKQGGEDAGLSKARLADLVKAGDLDREAVARLLGAMHLQTRPVKASALGVLGEQHLVNHMVSHRGVAPESVRYKK